jgi:uncharacterized protein YndB with AHSA1/START domain
MTQPFEVREEIELAATPDEVWAAIATGPGIDSWFMGRNQIEPREGGRGQMILGGFTAESTVTAWEPGRRFAFQSAPGPDGTFMAFEYLIEGRDAGSTTLRLVHSGFLSDWDSEYDAISVGDRMYLGKLASYLAYFPGQTATASVALRGPSVADAERVWAAFVGAVGLADPSGDVAVGDQARLTVDGVGPAEAVVDYVARPSFLGVRTGSALYRFIHGQRDTVVVEQHIFDADVDPAGAEKAWQDWLAAIFA